MGITDEQVWMLLDKSIEASGGYIGELYERGYDVADILNPYREMAHALAAHHTQEGED